MNVVLHPFYQYLIHNLLFDYLKLPDYQMDGDNRIKFQQKLGIGKDTYYKIERLVPNREGVDLNNPSSYTLRLTTVNKIAGVLRQCKTWEDMKVLYPLPDDAVTANIGLQHYRSLSDDQKEAIRNLVQKAFAHKPPSFKQVGTQLGGNPEIILKSIPAFSGCYLLVFYVKPSRSFRVFPLKITNGVTVELKRNEFLLLQGDLQQRGSNCFVWLTNNSSVYNIPISLVTTCPETNSKMLQFFSVTITTARNYRSISRYGNGFCFRITDNDYEQFAPKDEYAKADLNMLPCTIVDEIKYQLILNAVMEFDHSDEKRQPGKNSLLSHDSNYYGYFRRTSSNNELLLLPMCIENGFVRMKHPLYDLEFTGLLQKVNSVLWMKLKIANYTNNSDEENFTIQIKVNGASLSKIANGKQYVNGLFFATRSVDYSPICGDFLLQCAEFNYETSRGTSFLPDDNCSAELHNLRVLDFPLQY